MELLDSLMRTDYFAIFVIIAIGILVGKIEVKGIGLDSSAVIFVALAFGHFGYSVPPLFKTLGLILFIMTIGVQAGPGFFESFRSQGAKLVLVAGVIVVSGSIVAGGLAWFAGVDLKYAVGLLTGALTSTPGLAAAIEATNGSPEASIGYGIAYPFGVIGVILFVRLVPKVFKIDLKKEEEAFKKESRANYPSLKARNFKIDNDNIHGLSLSKLAVRAMTGANVSRVLKKGKTVVPTGDTILEKDDLIRVVGTKESLKKVELLVGESVDQEIPTSELMIVDWILVTNKRVVNKSIGSLNLQENYNATVTRIRRSGIDITPTGDAQIRFGDKLMVVSGTYNRDAVMNLFGNEQKKLSEADFLPIAAILVLGVILGKIAFPLFGSEFKLGLTGGVLLVSLMLSRVGKTGPIIWNVSGPANAMLRQLGLLFFLAAVGTSAGKSLVATIQSQGLTLFLVGFATTLMPMILSVIVGRIFLKVNLLSLLGTITGGMTSTPGLSAVDSMTDSNAPSIAYATVYPFAMVILIVCAKILGWIALF
ncbi:putative transporter [Fulvitalea axinellae]|uniref:Transporter n=1 Tax=Fulvitalea axinellae TaxID=1182444 RepID=A0AAU9DBE5_9BACT|nr:putative transporter [Fulvitalea axinellae]